MKSAKKVLQRLTSRTSKTSKKVDPPSETQQRYEVLLQDVQQVFPSASPIILARLFGVSHPCVRSRLERERLQATRWGEVLARHPRESETGHLNPDFDDREFDDARFCGVPGRRRTRTNRPRPW